MIVSSGTWYITTAARCCGVSLDVLICHHRQVALLWCFCDSGYKTADFHTYLLTYLLWQPTQLLLQHHCNPHCNNCRDNCNVYSIRHNVIGYVPAESLKVMRALSLPCTKSIFSISPPPDRFAFSNNIVNVSCLTLLGMLLTSTIAPGSLTSGIASGAVTSCAPSCRATRITLSLNVTVSLVIISSATATATVQHHVALYVDCALWQSSDDTLLTAQWQISLNNIRKLDLHTAFISWFSHRHKAPRACEYWWHYTSKYNVIIMV